MLFIEMDASEKVNVTVPSFAREVRLSDGSLHFWRYLIDGRAICVWYRVLGKFDSNARKLRIFLLRLNAEHQALKRVLKAIGDGTIAPPREDPISQVVQNYINNATRRILLYESKAQIFATEIDKLAFSVFDTAMPGERDALIERLRLLEMRGNIIRKVETYTSKAAVHIEMNGGILDMSTGDTINITGSTNINVKSTLTNVQQAVNAMPVGSDVQKQDLQKLLQELSDVLSKVPTEKSKEAETVAKRASQLVDAAAEDKPDASILKSIANGLKGAAEFVKDAIPSVVTIAGQIVSLIGNIHGIPI